jgi:hypothetical protein
MPLSFRQAGSLFLGGPNITIYPSGNTFAISGSSSGGGIISGTNVGTGIGVFCGLTTTNNANDTLGFYNLSGGNEVGISINDNDEIVIVRGRTVVNTLSNQGGGAKIFSAITGNTLLARTISGAAGLTSALAGTGNIITRIAPTNTTADRFYITTTGPVLNINNNFSIVPSVGTMSIGVSASSTSRLLLASGTSSISQLRLTPFSTEPTNPSDGSIWFSTSGNTLKFEKGANPTDFLFFDENISLTGVPSSTTQVLLVDTAGTISTKYVNSFGIFNTLSSVTVQNTSTETSIISSILAGSTTLLSSTSLFNPELVVGKKFRFNAKGTIQTDISSVDTLEIKIKLGSTTIGTTSAYTVAQNIPENTYFEIDVTFTIRNSNIVTCNGKIFGTSNIKRTPNLNLQGIYDQRESVITTANQLFDCTVKFDQANANNIIRINESTLEFLN